MTPCIEVAYKPVKGADHNRPVYHFKLAPGEAWLLDDTNSKHEVVQITNKMSLAAEDLFVLRFVNGKTVATFKIGDDQYAQPIPTSNGERVPRVRKGAGRRSIQAGPPAGSKPAETAVQRVEAPRREAPRRRAPLGLL